MSAPLRIAIIQSFLPSTAPHGGVGLQAHQIANCLVRRGHAVTVISRDPRPPGALYEVDRITLPAALDRKSMLAVKTHWFPFIVAQRDLDAFDIIHAHGDAQFLWRYRHKLVRTFHGSAFDEALSGMRGARARPKEIYWSSLQMSLYPMEWLSGAWAQHTLGISEGTRSRLPFIDEILPEGVDTGLFSPATAAVRNEKPVVLFIGSLRGRKRGELLREAFLEHVVPRVPEAELWMVCERDGMDGPVRYLPRRPHRELVPLFHKAWVFCLPSAYEGFGIPYIEAMATRTAVVATSNKGSDDALDHGRAGLLVPDTAIGPTLAELLLDSERRDAIAEAGFQWSRHYSFEVITSRYEEIYRDVISRGATGAKRAPKSASTTIGHARRSA